MTGICECGCGQPTKLAARTNTRKGVIAGQPNRFVLGHSGRHSVRGHSVEDRGYETPCHIYEGHLGPKGYAQTGGRGVHRTRWVEAHGPIPEGMELDHLCRQRDCVNIGHLELVTRRENMRRASIAWAEEKAEDDPTGVRALRVRLRLTQGELAERLGVDNSLICKWENGRQVIAKYHAKIGRAHV